MYFAVSHGRGEEFLLGLVEINSIPAISWLTIAYTQKLHHVVLVIVFEL